MPSDAYMELSPMAIWGESGDAVFGDKSPCGSFEIFSISFHTGSTDSGTDKMVGTDKDGNKTTIKVPKTGKMPKSNDGNTPKGQVTVEKPIDKASPFLFRYCVDKSKDYNIAWGVIYIRESGEESSTPWLRIEFQNLRITNFTWEIDPGGGGEEVNKSEKLEFEFDSMYIAYCQQDITGAHKDAVTSENRWNFADQNDDVTPIS